MTTYAQIVDGRARNVVTVHPTEAFNAEWLESNPPFSVVPDGTKHGALDNGNGTFTNPPAPSAEPKILTSTQFHALAASVVGVERLGDILLATKASTNGNAFFAWQRYSAANAPEGKFVKTDVAELSAGLVALGIMSAQERTNILAAWN